MLTVFIVYIIFFLILIIGYFRFIASNRINTPVSEISIIVPAKNEEQVIEDCINSLKRLAYPEHKFEVIIVDDDSSDNTYKSALKLTANKYNFKIIRVDNKSLPGKRGALLEGIRKASFPFIVITDADCMVPVNWLNSFSGLFEQGFDFVFGPAPLIRKHNNFIGGVSCMENLKSSFLSFSLASLALPYTAAARNMGFSKEAFFKIGEYSNTLDTLSGDDDLLLREAVKNKLKIKAFYAKDALVFSRAPSSLSEYLSQKTRHTQSSFHYLFIHRFILGIWHSLNLFMVFSPLLILLNVHFIWVFVLRMLIALIVFSSIQNKFGYKFTPLEILLFDVVCEVFIVVNFFNALFRKAEWKQNRKYQPG